MNRGKHHWKDTVKDAFCKVHMITSSERKSQICRRDSVKMVKEDALGYVSRCHPSTLKVCPMGTCIELKNINEAGSLITAVHNAVYGAGVKRIVTTVRIDDRREKDETMEYKVKRALEE